MLKTNRNLLIIALIVMVNMLGYGIIIPLLYGYSKRFGLSDFENGLLFAMFSLCQFIATPIIGRLSDKYGRKPMLLLSITGTAVSFFMMAFAPNALFLFIARGLDGLTAGNIPVAFAVISDSTKPQDRARAFGIIGAALSFGFVFGPAVAALTVGFGEVLPFLIAGIITVVAVILTAIYLPETNAHMGEVKKDKLFDFGKMWQTLFDANVGATFMISLVYFMAFACAIIYGFQPFTMHILGINQVQNAVLFTIFGTIGLISQTFLVQRLAKKLGTKKAFSYSMLFTAVSFLVMFFSHSLFFFVAAMIVLAFFNSVSQTLIPAILSQETDAKSQGTIMGGFVATLAIPLPFLAGSILVLACFFLSFNVMRPGIKKESAF